MIREVFRIALCRMRNMVLHGTVDTLGLHEQLRVELGVRDSLKR